MADPGWAGSCGAARKPPQLPAFAAASDVLPLAAPSVPGSGLVPAGVELSRKLSLSAAGSMTCKGTVTIELLSEVFPKLLHQVKIMFWWWPYLVVVMLSLHLLLLKQMLSCCGVGMH